MRVVSCVIAVLYAQGYGRPMARPTVYREDLATAVLDAMAAGESSKAACRRLGLPDTTVSEWRAQDRNGFRRRYFDAFACRAAGFGEEILDILEAVPPGADMATVQLARSKMDARRWLMSKLVPQYHEHVQHQLSGGATITISLPAKSDPEVPLLEGTAMLEGPGRGVSSGPRFPISE
jgi:hypothetical protein